MDLKHHSFFSRQTLTFVLYAQITPTNKIKWRTPTVHPAVSLAAHCVVTVDLWAKNTAEYLAQLAQEAFITLH